MVLREMQLQKTEKAKCFTDDEKATIIIDIAEEQDAKDITIYLGRMLALKRSLADPLPKKAVRL